jgi:cell division topological specificity factor
MLDFITRFFKREEASKTLAKERLRLVLMSDRVSLAPDVFDEMKGEMLSVIRRYLEIDERALDMHFENLERQFALLASIPVLKVRSADEIRATVPVGAAEAHAIANGASSNGAVPVNGSAASTETVRPAPVRRRRRRRRTNGTVSGNGVSRTEPENGAPPHEPPAGPDSAL